MACSSHLHTPGQPEHNWLCWAECPSAVWHVQGTLGLPPPPGHPAPAWRRCIPLPHWTQCTGLSFCLSTHLTDCESVYVFASLSVSTSSLWLILHLLSQTLEMCTCIVKCLLGKTCVVMHKNERDFIFSLSYITLTLHYITLHYITLHYTYILTLHYITHTHTHTHTPSSPKN